MYHFVFGFFHSDYFFLIDVSFSSALGKYLGVELLDMVKCIFTFI